jgi:hypothetical protein
VTIQSVDDDAFRSGRVTVIFEGFANGDCTLFVHILNAFNLNLQGAPLA